MGGGVVQLYCYCGLGRGRRGVTLIFQETTAWLQPLEAAAGMSRGQCIQRRMHYLYVVVVVFLRRRFVGVVLESELPPRLRRDGDVQTAIEHTLYICAYVHPYICTHPLLSTHYPLDHRRRCLLPRGKTEHVVVVWHSTRGCHHVAHAPHQRAVLYVLQSTWAVAVGVVTVGKKMMSTVKGQG